MPELSTVTQKGQVTIPIAIREYWGLEPQQQVVFVRGEDMVEIKPVVDFFTLKGSIKHRKKYSDKTANKAVRKYLAKQYAKTS